MNREDIKKGLVVKFTGRINGIFYKDIIGTVIETRGSQGVFFKRIESERKGHGLNGKHGFKYGGWYCNPHELKQAGEPIKIVHKDIPEYNVKIGKDIGVYATNETEALTLLKQPKVRTQKGTFLFGKKIEV